MQSIKNDNIFKKGKMRTIQGVTGKVMKFSQKLHDKYDVDAREILCNVLGDAIKENENKYAEDMIFTQKDFPYKFLEVQVYTKWDGENFPYSQPFIYARKMRFDKSTLFVTFNKFYTEMIIFGRTCVLNTPSRLKKYDREHVHFVPWGRSMRLKTPQLTPKLIKIYSGDHQSYFDWDLRG